MKPLCGTASASREGNYSNQIACFKTKQGGNPQPQTDDRPDPDKPPSAHAVVYRGESAIPPMLGLGKILGEPGFKIRPSARVFLRALPSFGSILLGIIMSRHIELAGTGCIIVLARQRIVQNFIGFIDLQHRLM